MSGVGRPCPKNNNSRPSQQSIPGAFTRDLGCGRTEAWLNQESFQAVLVGTVKCPIFIRIAESFRLEKPTGIKSSYSPALPRPPLTHVPICHIHEYLSTSMVTPSLPFSLSHLPSHVPCRGAVPEAGAVQEQDWERMFWLQTLSQHPLPAPPFLCCPGNGWVRSRLLPRLLP